MTLENPWVLITFDEIEGIQKRMQVVHEVILGTARQNARESIYIINKVLHRRV
ncbi:MAG: hypothetical protein M0Q91_13060 [Methanoregula sp.]|jgi:Trp operon repressor|nr:hypothetical protein [Methanoregula sp.]